MKLPFLPFLTFFLVINNIVAQGSGIVQPVFDTAHKSIETVVRNFNDKYIIISDYGFDPDGPTPNEHVVNYTTFYIQNIESGVLTKLFKMPYGYDVHDVRFVYLRKDSIGTIIDSFCCFCGTKYRFIGEYYSHTIGNEPATIEYVFDSSGFAGFFSMKDAIESALNPSQPTTATAKVRAVEGTSALYRMTSYAEGPCHYFIGSAYYDNAVLDIIGVSSDTLGLKSCFSRAKFYPEYNNSILWDNNLRYNNSNEILCDITSTDDYIVTASRFKNNRHDIFLRHSIKESSGCLYGGCELNNIINYLDWESLRICEINTFNANAIRFEDSLRLCHLTGENYALAIGITENSLTGILTFRFNRYDCYSSLFGRFEIGLNRLQELVYLKRPVITVALAFDEEYQNSTAKFNTWAISECKYYDYNIRTPAHFQQSLTVFNDYDLFWGCIPNNSNYQFSLMSYSWPISLYDDDCSIKDTNYIYESSVSTFEGILYLPIQIKYEYDIIQYPITTIYFKPQIFPLERICEGVN